MLCKEKSADGLLRRTVTFCSVDVVCGAAWICGSYLVIRGDMPRDKKLKDQE